MGKGSFQLRLLLFGVIAAILWLLRLRFNAIAKPVTPAKPNKSCDEIPKKKKKKGTNNTTAGLAAIQMDLFCQRVQEIRSELNASEIAHLFPKHFEVLGHVVVVKLNSGVTRDTFMDCAEAFATSLAPRVVDIVLMDSRGVAGELRRPQPELLWMTDAKRITSPKLSLRQTLRRMRANDKTRPSFVEAEDATMFEKYTDSLTFTTHMENQVRYSFDVCRVMFCSGNGTERMHFSKIEAKDEVVVDMFTGIGYFTLPLALNGGVQIIHALEKNIDSVVFLKYNTLQNEVDHLVRTYCGDNREVGTELLGKCDRVLMGYLPSCDAFLPRAVSFLKRSPAGVPCGMLHYHYLSDKNTAQETALQHAHTALGEDALKGMKVSDVRVVKSYAPKRYHCVADLLFGNV